MNYKKVIINHILIGLLLSLLLPVGAIAGYWKEDWNKVDHILECVVKNGENSYTAFFGYNNNNFFPVDIPIGYFNRFNPNPLNQGQTTHFLPGRVINDFSINYSGSKITWILNERKLSASNVTKSCIRSGDSISISRGSIQSPSATTPEPISDNSNLSEYYPSPDSTNSVDGGELVIEVPEYSTIGAVLVLIGACAFVYYKKRKI